MQKCLVVLAVTLCVVACKNQQAAGTSTDGEVVASSDATVGTALRDEIAQVHKQIGETEQESSRYSGGLVKALIESRLQTLKQTLAMLEQRNKAWTFGLRLRYTIDGKLFQLPPGARQQLPQIEQELRDEAAKIRAQEQESAQYSGGLVQALSLSTLATMKQTQAMLDQKRLAIQ